MSERPAYDTELGMFVDSTREPDCAHLRFLRWLVEQGLLEHEAASLPTGEYAVMVQTEIVLAR
jgi:hypothetical protein